MSEIFLPQLFRRRILASDQDRQQTLHTCYFWQAASAGVQSTVPAHSKIATLRKHTLSAPARSTEHMRWLPAKSNRCAASAACLGRSPKVAARNSCGTKTSDNSVVLALLPVLLATEVVYPPNVRNYFSAKMPAMPARPLLGSSKSLKLGHQNTNTISAY